MSKKEPVEGEIVQVGRPTKLTPALIERAKAYNWEGKKVPTLEGFALYLGVNRSSIYEWKDKDPEFSNIVDNILANQADILIQKGLSGEFNSSITKLILSGKHNYVEKSEVDNKHTGTVSFVNDVPRPKRIEDGNKST